MKMGLDLNVFEDKFWELILIGGEVLKIKKPTQKLMMSVINVGANPALNGEVKGENVDEVFDVVATITTDILNNNDAGEKYTKSQAGKMLTLDMQIAIIYGYTDFINEVMSNPN